MRTKTLLLTAAVGAAGVATSMAQVFSVNAVGYVNVTVKKGLAMIANPLNATDNKVSTLLGTSLPDGTTVYKFNAATSQYEVNGLNFGSWDLPNQTLAPGEGAFISNPGPADITLTFVGEVPQGSLQNAVPKGFSIKSSQVPQAGALDTDLKFPIAEDDTVYKWNTTAQNYDPYSFSFGTWSGPGGGTTAPQIGVGESFFVSSAAGGSWNRTFSVNQ
jgi:hypothetical protein